MQAWHSLFGLEITVNNLVSMAVLDGTNDLLEEASGFVLGHLGVNRGSRGLAHLAFGDNVVEEFFTGVFHDHDDICRSRDDFVSATARQFNSAEAHLNLQLDDVRMPKHLEVLNLPLDSSAHVLRSDLRPVDHLESDLMAGNAMGCDCSHQSLPLLVTQRTFDFAKAPTSKRPFDDIASNTIRLARS